MTPLVQVDAGNAQRFWEALVPASQDHSIVVVNLTALRACGWHVLSALVMALKYTDVSGAELRVAAGGPAVRRALTEAGLDRLITPQRLREMQALLFMSQVTVQGYSSVAKATQMTGPW